MFDASDSTGGGTAYPFHDLSYSFDYGDQSAGTWAVSGISKNSDQGGAFGAHIYDTPGTYTVTLTVRDEAGDVSTRSTVITVADPNQVYSGTKTVCISQTTDFTGCPVGAAQRSTMPSGTEWSGKRFLFMRGQDFTPLGAISIQDGNSGVQLGAFGVGEKPIVHSIGVGDWRPSTADFAQDITVMDLKTLRNMSSGDGMNHLFYRNDIVDAVDPNVPVNMGFGGTWWALSDTYRTVPANQFYTAHNIFFVENTVRRNEATKLGGSAFGSGYNLVFLGNPIGPSEQHNLRITWGYKVLVAHNRLVGVSNDGSRHALKLHSGGLDVDYSSILTPKNGRASAFVQISHNEFGSAQDNNAWTVAIMPQNSQSAEGIQDVRVENNRFIHGVNNPTDLNFSARRVSYSGDTFGAAPASVAFGGHGESLSADWLGPYWAKWEFKVKDPR
jgi:hypothetical protein